jgi:hypothetical protein
MADKLENYNSNNNNNNNNVKKPEAKRSITPRTQSIVVSETPVDTSVYEDKVDVVTLTPKDALVVRDIVIGNKADIAFRMLAQTSDICRRIGDYIEVDKIADPEERRNKGRILNVENFDALRGILLSAISAIATALMITINIRTAYQKAKIIAMMEAKGKFMSREHYINMAVYKVAYAELIPLLYGAFKYEVTTDWDKAPKLPAFYAYLEEKKEANEMKFRPNITENNIDQETIALAFANLVPLVMTGNFVLVLLSHMSAYEDEAKSVEKMAAAYIEANYPLIREAHAPVKEDGASSDAVDESQPGRYEKYLFNLYSNITVSFGKARENFGLMMRKLPEDKVPETHEQLKSLMIEYVQTYTGQKVTPQKKEIALKNNNKNNNN